MLTKCRCNDAAWPTQIFRQVGPGPVNDCDCAATDSDGLVRRCRSCHRHESKYFGGQRLTIQMC